MARHDDDEAPLIEIVGPEPADPPDDGMRRVTTGGRSRHLAIGAVVVVLSLVGASVLWDVVATGADDEAAAEVDAVPSTTTSQPRRATTTTLPRRTVEDGGLAEPAVSPALEGFEDQWLLVVEQSSGRILQLPLGGGEVIELRGRQAGGGTIGSPAPHRLIGDTLLEWEQTYSLVDGATWTYRDPAGGQWIHPLGVTSAGTIIFTGEQLAERTVTGEVVNEWPMADQMPWGWWGGDAVVGRTLIQNGLQGVLQLDLDTGDVRRLATGELIAVGDAVVVVRVCDDRLRCEGRVIELADGTVRSRLGDLPSQIYHYDPRHTMEATLSPDQTRLAVLSGEQVEIHDIVSGGLVGTIGLPPVDTSGLRVLQLDLVWSPDSEVALLVAGGTNFTPDGPRLAYRFDRDLNQVDEVDWMHSLLDAEGARANLVFVLSSRPYEPLP